MNESWQIILISVGMGLLFCGGIAFAVVMEWALRDVRVGRVVQDAAVFLAAMAGVVFLVYQYIKFKNGG